MKKNLMSIIILALVLANLVLTAILTFTIIPQTKKSNELIDQVATAINLELESGQNRDTSSIPIENIETYTIEQSFTVNLADSGSGTKDYAVFTVGLSLNTQSADYEAFGGLEGIATKETIIKDKINGVASSYTLSEFNANGYEDVKNAILKEMQTLFDSTDLVVGVNFSSVTTESR